MKNNKHVLGWIVILSKQILYAAILIGLLAGCGPETTGPTKSILFIGNSFTSVNNLPNLFTQLALSGGKSVTAAMCAQGGYKLFQHAADPVTGRELEEHKWDVVVLQEQSQTPAIENDKNAYMYPAIRDFNERIRKAGAVPMLYLTWGRKNGDSEFGYSDYSSMQEALTLGYMGIAQELSIEVAPVGAAWKTAHERQPILLLWAGDGIHPALAGSYLAACVFYAVIYGKSPEGLGYTAGLPLDTATFLQAIAAETVLTDPKKWFIPQL
jgi:hypothetical protein